MIDPEPDPFRIFGDSDERFHVRGGNDLCASTLAEALQATDRDRRRAGGGEPRARTAASA